MFGPEKIIWFFLSAASVPSVLSSIWSRRSSRTFTLSFREHICLSFVAISSENRSFGVFMANIITEIINFQFSDSLLISKGRFKLLQSNSFLAFLGGITFNEVFLHCITEHIHIRSLSKAAGNRMRIL